MITIVSGLPRSGTSLMMQMLAAGGLEILSDHVRGADDDNPRGYYEFEKVKSLKKDSSWLADADGKAIKVVSMLLYDLPPAFQYKVIFMERSIEEILASQQKMLARRGVQDKGPSDEQMKQHFRSHLEKLNAWLPRARHLEVLRCSYNELVGRPQEIVPRIIRLLGIELDATRMIRAIDQSLYRQRL